MKKGIFFILFLYVTVGFSQTDIFSIARKGTAKQMHSFLEKNPSKINAKNEHGFTPLIICSYANNLEVAKVLLDKKADPNILSDMGTALMAATYKNNIEIAKILLQNKADVNITDAKGTTALHYATLFNYYPMVKILMQYNAKRNLKDVHNKTAVDYAIEMKSTRILKLLNN